MQRTLVVYQWGLRAIVGTCAVGSVIFGFGLIWGGPARFGSPGFAVARELPGTCYTWGVMVMACGAVTIAGVLTGWHRRTVVIGTAGQGVWFLFFAVALLGSFINDPKVATTGWMIYGLVAVVHFLLCATGHALLGLPR